MAKLISSKQIEGLPELKENIEDILRRLTAIEESGNIVEGIVERITVSGGSKHSFTLQEIPNQSTITVFVNTVPYFEGEHFTVDRPSKILSWTFSSTNGGFDITDGDEVVIKYKTQIN
jgi:hypothetical protein